MKFDFDWFDSFERIPVKPADWRAMVAAKPQPFLNYEWFSALEGSGSVNEKSGWSAQHLVVSSGAGTRAIALHYLRTTSWGEIFFDYSWAQAASEMGLRFYPKLVGCIPATPVEGYDWLFAADAGDEEKMFLRAEIWKQVQERARILGAAQVSYNYAAPELLGFLRQNGALEWRHHSFRWNASEFSSWDDYLATFTKSQRHTIRRELRRNLEAGYRYRVYSGDSVPEEGWLLMYDYYRRVNDKFGSWAARFLNKAFFVELARVKPSWIRLVCAYRDDADETGSGSAGAADRAAPGSLEEDLVSADPWEPGPVAMAFLGDSGQNIFGRYWGQRDDGADDFLHFALCYYIPQYWAILNRRGFFDPGVGSFHKARRGFLSTTVSSAHLMFDPRLRELMASYLPQVNERLRQEIDEINSDMPRRR